MPRLPVDGKRVQEFRVTLGTYERERLDLLITGMTFRNVGIPTVALLSDVSALEALAAILEALGIIDLTGLAKKLGGQGKDWIDSVMAGLFNSLDEALLDWEKRIQDLYPKWMPGGEPLIDPYVPPEEYTLSTSERAWAMTQIYSQSPRNQPGYTAATDPTHRGYGGL